MIARVATPSRRAFTLIEIMIAMVVVAIVAFAVIPALAPEEGVKLVSASHMLAGDLEYAQSASLATPADPVVVVFDPESPRYWLAHKSDPATPLERPGSGAPYVVEMGQDLAQALGGVGFEVGNVADATIPYDAFGRLDQLADAFVRVHNDSGELFVVISSATGSVAVARTSPPVVEPKGEEAAPIVLDPPAAPVTKTR